jgi:chromosome partitioning protein
MHSTIAVCSQKGGVGKTTLTLNLGVALAELGTPTTILELDPQGGLSGSLLATDVLRTGLAQVVWGSARVAEAHHETKVPGLSLMAVGGVDPDVSLDFEDRIAEGSRLSDLLGELFTAGSRIILCDCPSGFGTVVQAGLRCASHALVPLQTEPLSLRSVERFLHGIEGIRHSENPGLKLLGLVLMMLDKQSDASISVLTATWGAFDPTVVLETVIPRRDEFLRASLHGVPVGFLAPDTHQEGRRFQLLAQEVLQRLSDRGKEEPGHGEPFRTLL